MSERLDALARSHGIQTHYVSELGEDREITQLAKTALLEALKVDSEIGVEGHFALRQHAPTRRCIDPASRVPSRAWGMAIQLYGLRSRRNLGIGDFADLADLAEIGGKAGAAFLGVNPLHALFLADPGRYSPYSPSTRRFLNPFYIAIDKLEGGQAAIAALRREEPGLFEGLDGDLVDYPAVGRLKARLLRTLFEDVAPTLAGNEAFRAFLTTGGGSLRNFSLFEAISAQMVAEGGSPGWHNWPDEFHERDGAAARRFEAENEAGILFHEWLQFVADRQLGAAQARAVASGMAIGLYLDFAVGVSPDGAETWADPHLTIREARVGSPPDMFNSSGQDWGLAPLSPEALAQEDYAPLAAAYEAMMRHAGAVRIDHAMGLARLWWIPQTGTAADGGYVRYPLGAMIDKVAEASTVNRCIVVGEDLGTVPVGFRPAMQEANILSYKVLYFERTRAGGFVAPAAYPKLSLACVSTHDLATLAGWWKGSDVALRAETGRQDASASARDAAEREEDRRALLRALSAEGLLPDAVKLSFAESDALPDALSEDLAVAIHRYAARTGSILFAVQLEDMLLAERQANLPGTMDEYPNWRLRSTQVLEDVAAIASFQAIARAMREERSETA